MGLKELLGKFKMPTKRGKTTNKPAFTTPEWESVYYLDLVNLEGSPRYELTHQLSIGSEIGNIVIADPSLSSRHCTFSIQQEVISLIDHGSIEGTLINGVKVSSGKFIILEESDKIQVGDLEVKISRENKVIENNFEEEEDEVVEEEEILEEEIEEVEEEEDIPEKPGKKLAAPQKKNTNKKKGLSSMSFGSVEKATNTLPRLFALIADLLIAASLHAVLVPFDDYKAYQQFVPGVINDLLGQDLSVIWDAFLQDQPAIAELIKDFMSETTKSFPVIDILIDFAVLRFVSTLVLSVSLSEFFLGIKSVGNQIWARVGGALRVLIGLITGPFLIFDVPALVSRRTFKEFLTFTHTTLRGKFLFSVLALVYMPACIALFFVSPMFQGLDFPAPVAFSDRIPNIQSATRTDGESVVLTKMKSEVLGFSINIDEVQVTSFVDLKFQSKEKKKIASPFIGFYFPDSERGVELSVEKTFEMRDLLSIAVKGNYFLHEKYPEITSYLYDASTVNKSFASKMTAREELQFTTEMIDLLKTSLELSVDNFIDTMETHTLIIKSLIEFKSSLLSLVPEQFSSVDLVRWGNQTCLRFTYLSGIHPYDLLVPLKKGQGKIYRLSFDKASQLKDLKDSFYKVHLSMLDWKLEGNTEETAAVGMNTFEAYDFINSLNDKKVFSDDTLRNLYVYYYQLSKKILTSTTPHPAFDAEFGQTLNRVYETLKSYIGNPKYEQSQNTLMTLEKSFLDMMTAYNEKNLQFFENI